MPPGPDPQKRPQPPGPRGQPPTQRPPAPAQRRQPRPPAPKRRHHHGRAGRARVGIVVIFVFLRVVDALFFIALPANPHGLFYAALIGAALWTTALLVALWRRQVWARLILLGLFGLSAVAATIMIPASSLDTPLLTAYLAAALLAIASGAWLLYSRDVHRLTSRDRE